MAAQIGPFAHLSRDCECLSAYLIRVWYQEGDVRLNYLYIFVFRAAVGERNLLLLLSTT